MQEELLVSGSRFWISSLHSQRQALVEEKLIIPVVKGGGEAI
jgi:hypothetical protein